MEDEDDETKVSHELDHCVDAPAIIAILATLPNTPPADISNKIPGMSQCGAGVVAADSALDLLQKYQEQPFLLDKHLGESIASCAGS